MNSGIVFLGFLLLSSAGEPWEGPYEVPLLLGMARGNRCHSRGSSSKATFPMLRGALLWSLQIQMGFAFCSARRLSKVAGSNLEVSQEVAVYGCALHPFNPPPPSASSPGTQMGAMPLWAGLCPAGKPSVPWGRGPNKPRATWSAYTESR